MDNKYEGVLVYDRDWERIKNEALGFLPEEKREAIMVAMVKKAVYN